MRGALRLSSYVVLVLGFHACASGQAGQHADEARVRIQQAMHSPVDNREARDQESRVLADNIESARLETLDMSKLRQLFGPGMPCTNEVCQKQGFSPDDWFYEIGMREGKQVERLPLLLVGFDPHGQVKRVFTYTTH
jgi:hypothetical protein